MSTLKFVKLQSFAKKQKCLSLRPKILYLIIFGLEFLKAIVVFEISTLIHDKFQNFTKIALI